MLNIAELYSQLLDKTINSSLSDIIKTASIYLHQHITMLDVSFNLLTSWPQETIGDPYWDAQQTYGYVPEENLTSIYNHKYPNKTFSGPVYIDWGNVVIPRCAISLIHQEKTLGHVSIYHTDYSLSKEDLMQALICLCKVLKLYLIKFSVSTTSQETIKTALVSRIFFGQRIDDYFYQQWESATGQTLCGKYFVIAISQQNLHNSILTYLSQRLSHSHSKSAYVEVDGYGYFLFYGIDSNRNVNIIIQQFRSILQSYKLYCGISMLFTDLKEINSYMYQSRKALEFGKTYEKNQCCHHYVNHRTNIMLSYIAENMHPCNYTHELFSLLIAEDQKKGTQYYKTLCTYLDCGLDSFKTASQLVIHRNTLLYRIRHIETEYSVSFNDPIYLKNLLLSHMVRQSNKK